MFVRYIVPGLLIFLVLSAVLAGTGARYLIEGVCLEQATKRAQVIDRVMAEAAPDHWRRLNRGEAPASVVRLRGSPQQR
ncbi:MAG: hypothetical protein F9K44_15730 [Hyphomicrobiaceae bacterium]|nr:MAG: hypothetical protein F9K44_15730 [Hyphomicrobiaceae bacterium]